MYSDTLKTIVEYIKNLNCVFIFYNSLVSWDVLFLAEILVLERMIIIFIIQLQVNTSNNAVCTVIYTTAE